MKGILISCLFYCTQLCCTAQDVPNEILVNQYIQAFNKIAVEEMIIYHIPASITLAQGIHESGAGQSKLARNANNHFGIKCHKEWYGKTYYQEDDKPNECFRKYDRAEDSFRDHSYFLSQRDRYKGLFKLSITDYKAWAEGLEAAGYASNPQYAESLVRIIEKYRLFIYDQGGAVAVSPPPEADSDIAVCEWVKDFRSSGTTSDGRKIYINNGLSCIVARKGDNVQKLSSLLNLSRKHLIRYNDLKTQGVISAGQVIYLESKKRKAEISSHVVEKGETLYEISQRYGVRMKILMKRNKIRSGYALYTGQVLHL